MGKWISVRTKLPKECQRVWASFKEPGKRHVFSDDLYYWPSDKHWTRNDLTLLERIYKVTHWMPLPDPPKGGR